MPQFCTYESMQDALTNRYTSFACLNRPARLAPVGEAFRYNSGGGFVVVACVGGCVGVVVSAVVLVNGDSGLSV